jgi:RNA polymerase sigma-70 factor, ECF subfamily
VSRAEQRRPAAQPDRSSEAEIISLERALVGRAQAGDREALRLLLMRHADTLYSKVILPRAGDPSTAEDVLKATMVTAIEKIGTFRWQGRSIYFWLRQIAVNKVIDHHRGNQRTWRLAQSLAEEPELSIGGTGAPGPETALIAAEEKRINGARIERALSELSPRYRRAIELRLLQELPREECARQLEVTLGTFDVVFFRAVRAFRRTFGEP